MTGTQPNSQPHPKFVLIFIFCLLVLAAVAFALPQSAAASPSPDTVPPQTGDDACLGCHSQPGMTMPLPSGETLPVEVNPENYQASVHGENGVACTDCHTDISGYPHPEFPAQDRRDVAIHNYVVCQQCHAEQYEAQKDSVHQAALANGNKDAAVCSDCHDPHAQPRVTDAQTGETRPIYRVNEPVICSKCHSAIYEEYRTSVHGATLLAEGNLDVPSCTDCHGVHGIPDPTTVEFRLNSPEICADCHTDPVKMPKYGLSTQVLDTYVDDFHGTTVTLFQRQHPDQPVNTPVCFDCHGVHNIARVDDPERGLEIKQNLLQTCQRCHPDATENFPASWMSHYIPDPQKTPLVFYVQLFYLIFVPTVLGGMAFYVITDFIRRRAERRKGAKSE